MCKKTCLYSLALGGHEWRERNTICGGWSFDAETQGRIVSSGFLR